MLQQRSPRKTNERTHLLTNAIDVRAIPIIFNSWMASIDEKYKLNNFNRKWKAVIRDAGIDTKRFYQQLELQRVKHICVNVAALYYFCFYFYLRYINVPSLIALEKFYASCKNLKELTDLGFYFTDGGCILFKEVDILKDSEQLRKHFMHTEEINQTMIELIDQGLLIMREDNGHYFWTIEGVDTLCYITRQLLQYLPNTV